MRLPQTATLRMRPAAPPPLLAFPRGCLGGVGRWTAGGGAGGGERNGNRKRKRRAQVNRFSLQSGGLSGASRCPRARPRSAPRRLPPPRPAPPPAARGRGRGREGERAESERPPAGGGAPALRAAALAPWRCCRPLAASPARVPARRPRCLTRNSCGPSKTETWMR